VRTALEILARRRRRRALAELCGGYRVAAPPEPDPHLEAFLVFAEYLYPNDVDRMLDAARTLAAGRTLELTRRQQRHLLLHFGGVRMLSTGRSWWSKFWTSPGVGEFPVEVSTREPLHARAASPCATCGARYDEDCDAGLHG